MQNIKGIVTDLDGTAFNNQHTLSKYTAEVFAELIKQKKYKFALATGRHHLDVTFIYDLIGYTFPIVSNNGAIVYDENGKLIHNLPIDNKIAEKIIALDKFNIDDNLLINIYQGDYWYSNEKALDADIFHKFSNFQSIKIDPLNYHNYDNIFKIFYLNQSKDKNSKILLDIQQYLIDNFGSHIFTTFSSDICLEISHPLTNKAEAINILFHRYGFGIGDCLAFGNALNDFEMLVESKQGCLVDNASLITKKALEKYPHIKIIDTNQNDAVAKYIEKHYL